MKLLCLFLPLAMAQAVLANRFTSSDHHDSETGTAGVDLAKTQYFLASQAEGQLDSSYVNEALKAPRTTKPALVPPQGKLPSYPEVYAIPHPHVITVPHPSAYIAHHEVPEEQHHLDVLQLSNGLQAVPLDDHYGHVSDYLYLGSEINLVPGSHTFYLPATDPIDGHTTYVNLDTESGHLSLSQIRIGNTIQQGFEGVDDFGPVFVPVMRKSQRLVVYPVVYRSDKPSYYQSSSSSKFSSTLPISTAHSSYTHSVDNSPFHHIVF